ncbi:hypothetical protein CKO13_09660 [Halorhodospira neutriphila]|uniref:histidine kinase n=1 Tax=Halorhodospira neutriphila TaxID=168379 RepID=A0ABS1E7V8_9GAMM|nr:hypothetical protein [Halorhodospira neutriphila]
MSGDDLWRGGRDLQAAADAVGLGAWRVELGEERIELSAEACALFGLPAEEAGPRSTQEAWRFYAPEHRAPIERAFRDCVEQASPYDIEFEALTAAGQRRWLRATGEPVRGDDGGVVAVRGALQDIDPYKRREAELREAWREAERTDRAKSEFLSAMSHELRTPLNAILGFAQLLNAGIERDPEEHRAYLRHILSAGWHLRDLVGDLLDLARVEAGKTSFSPEPVRVGELLQECVRLAWEQAVERGVSIRLEEAAEGSACRVWADRLRAKQIVLNLLTNAVKYNRDGGSVTLSFHPEGEEEVAIDVRDTGIGIPRERSAALFESFERLGHELGEIEGAGLGLALALRLSRLMGGDLALVASEPGEGSHFRLRLPAAEAEGHDRSYGPSLDPQLLDDAEGEAPIQLLYVEDNSVNQLLLQGLAGQRGGVELLEANDAVGGLEIAERYAPDLILLDIHLPDMDGYELVRRLRAIPALEAVPVVAVSADATDEARRRALASGFDDYILKPFELEELNALIREIRLSK